MKYIDTQVLSYKYKGNTELYKDSINNQMISSIVACEFLNVFKKNDLKNASYYPFYNEILISATIDVKNLFDSKKHCMQGKHRTDRVLIDLKNNYESFIIYGNESISKLLNSRFKKEIMIATEHLSKENQKNISSKIDFILDNNLKVVPLNENIITNMLIILASIEGKYNIKMDFKNSIMDLLIASTALTDGSGLITIDKELNRILCKDYNLNYNIDKNILMISENDINKETFENKARAESKNYINKGWQYKIRKM